MAQRTRARSVSSSGTAEPQPQIVPVAVTTQVGDETVTYHANYAEVVSLQHEFAILFSRVPTKLRPEKQEEVKAGGVLTLTTEVQIVMPATMIGSMIRALEVAKKLYEGQFGVIREPGGSDADSTGR